MQSEKSAKKPGIVHWPRRAVRGAALAAVWIVLAGISGEALAAGAVLVPLAVLLSLRLLPDGVPVRFGRVLALLPHFVARSLAGGIDVAWRAFHPRLPIKPGWVELPSRLHDVGRVAVGGELSLMPGTLVAGSLAAGSQAACSQAAGSQAAGSQDRVLLVHVLDMDQDVEPALREEERRVERTLGQARDVRQSG